MSSSTSSDNKCIGAGCNGVVNFTPQLRDLISGPNPDIVKAANMLLPCPTCKKLASSPKAKIVTVLALHGINELPKAGSDPILFEPKNVRYKLDVSPDDRHYGWQYRCGDDTFKWYVECKTRCLGISKIEDFSRLFELLYSAIRAPEGSPEADLTKVFDMCKHCGYGHPNACGEVQFADVRKNFIMSIIKPCRFGDKCKGGASCTTYHGSDERARVFDRLEAYVKTIADRVEHAIKWGISDAPSKAVSKAAAPVLASTGTWAATLAADSHSKAVEKMSAWTAPTLPVKTLSKVTVPPILSPPTVLKTLIEDDSVGVNELHQKYIAGLRARSVREKAEKAETAKEIIRLNKLIESHRAKMERLDVDISDTDRLLADLSTPAKSKTSSVSAAPHIPELKSTTKVAQSESKMPESKQSKTEMKSPIKKKAVLSISTPQSMPRLTDNATFEESDGVVDVMLSADDSLSGPLVIMPSINA